MPETVAHYTLLDRIGGGALGELHRARDTVTGRTVALRLLPPASQAGDAPRAERLEHARRLAELSHPGIASLFGAGEHDGRLYLASEFVPGTPLSALVAGHPLNVRKAVELARQIAEALDVAHRHGLVHGGLRAEAVIVTPKGRAKILDLGLAGRPWRTVDAPTAPATAPEQVLGQRAETASDMFALGVLLYQMLTGTAPFGQTAGETLEVQILQTIPPPPGRTGPRIPPALDELTMMLLHKDPHARPERAAAVAARLETILAGLSTADVPPIPPSRPKISAGAWWLLGTGVLVLLTLAFWLLVTRI